MLEETPGLCNTYLLWSGSFGLKHWQHDYEFKLHVDYHEVLARAVNESVASWDALAEKIAESVTPRSAR